MDAVNAFMLACDSLRVRGVAVVSGIMASALSPELYSYDYVGSSDITTDNYRPFHCAVSCLKKTRKNPSISSLLALCLAHLRHWDSKGVPRMSAAASARRTVTVPASAASWRTRFVLSARAHAPKMKLLSGCDDLAVVHMVREKTKTALA